VAVYIYTQTMHRTTQITTEQQKITNNVEECGLCPVFASFALAFALQLRKKHGKTLVRVQYTYYQTPTHYKTHTNTHITKPTNTHTHTLTHTHTNTHTHITKQYKTTTVQIKTNTVQDITK
jgi:hypothetical protein